MVYWLEPEMASLCLQAAFGITGVMKQNFCRKAVDGRVIKTHMEYTFQTVSIKEV
jgi:hypothetical protein